MRASSGFDRIDFLGDVDWALPTLILIDVWQWTPFTFLIMLAALQGVPEDVIEAAKIDGARSARIFFDHMLPLMRYPIAVALVLRLLDAFRVYDIIFMTTRGGPIDVTQTLSWQIYDAGFKSLRYRLCCGLFLADAYSGRDRRHRRSQEHVQKDGFRMSAATSLPHPSAARAGVNGSASPSKVWRL